MKAPIAVRLAAIAGAVVIVFACAPAPPAALSQADQDAVRAASKAYTQTIVDTNWKQFAASFADDGELLPTNNPVLRGHDAIEKWARGFPPTKGIKIEPREITGSGNTAIAVGTYSMTIMIPGAPPVADTGKYIEVWHRQTDGSWKVFRDAFNSDIPLPMPSAPPAKKK